MIMRRKAFTTSAVMLAAGVMVSASALAQERSMDFEEDVLRDPTIAEHMLGAGWEAVDREIEMRAVDEKALEVASQWQSGAHSAEPTAGPDGRVVYEYGTTTPRVTCALLRVCDIEMQAGEVVYDAKAGDDKRWIITGVDAAPRQHVAVKPKAPNLLTNLAIYTDRRVYVIELASPAEERAPYTPLVSFAYPDDERAQWARLRARAANRKDVPGRAGKSESDEYELHVKPGALHFGYKVKKAGRWLNRRRTKWTPVRVYDDGEKTFVEMPKRMQETPVLVIRDGGQNAIVNVRWKGRTMIVDRLFDKGLLMLGAGWYQQRVAITREEE